VHLLEEVEFDFAWETMDFHIDLPFGVVEKNFWSFPNV